MSLAPLLAALRARPPFAQLSIDDLVPLAATGTAHGHVRIVPPIDGRRLLARIAYAHPGDAGASARLHRQAAAFRHVEQADVTPRLVELIEPADGLPGGVLIVDAIDGRPPHLPHEMALIADTLAALHALPLPANDSVLPRLDNPFRATMEVIEDHAARFLDHAVPEPRARAGLAEELHALRAMALTLGRRPQPMALALGDTHPGNFLVDDAGKAWFVDLEKVHGGSAAIDLAHASLPTSTLWTEAAEQVLSIDELRVFHRRYLERIGGGPASALRPWLLPMRRLTWLRTMVFFCRWRVQTRAPRDPADPGQWSASGMAPAMLAHIDRRIDDCFKADSIHAMRAEWRDDLLQ
ncbi:MAG: aminoglycoside phosphotransferase family protein [Alphaproteobacteria bacterium]|nr:aminoglycoside phosphotransferase family protein [Alphaproteobacteria bacterium]MCW5741938.1 aminoglycoside phosphotransferase family protein [Alphaproteobacteria bacterium]